MENTFLFDETKIKSGPHDAGERFELKDFQTISLGEIVEIKGMKCKIVDVELTKIVLEVQLGD